MSAAIATREPHPLVVLNEQLKDREAEFKAALPAHIPVERFMRVVLTAVQNNPDLIAKVSRRTLFTSAIRAAQDGLLPDGREGAIVPYKGNAQWMPMIAGIRKKVRNSGEIATWDAHVVYEHDAFEFELGDEPFIRHKPALSERGKPIAAYSIAVLKGGEKTREVMSIGEINAIRARSRAKDSGPWVTDYAEMCRKTVARRHSKVLPMSTDLDDLLRRDDELYDFKGARDEAKDEGRRPRLVEQLDQLATSPTIDHDPETGEVKADDTTESAAAPAPSEAETGAGAPTTQESASGAPAADGEGDPGDEEADDSPRGQLLDRLRGRAMAGGGALRLALKKLTEAESALLTNDDVASLTRAANASEG